MDKIVLSIKGYRGREGELIHFYFLGHQWKTVSQTDLQNSATERAKSWAILMIINMAVELMISRVWGFKKRLVYIFGSNIC